MRKRSEEMKNGAFKIDKGIPMPKLSTHGETMNTLRAMKIGDSFLYPAQKRNGINGQAQRAGIKIVTRAAGKDKVRVWRTK